MLKTGKNLQYRPNTATNATFTTTSPNQLNILQLISQKIAYFVV
jgi:hypothetical protein